MRLFTFFFLLVGLFITSCNSPKAGADYDKSIMPEGYDPNAKLEIGNNNQAAPSNLNDPNITIDPNSGIATNSTIQQQQMQVTQMPTNGAVNKTNNAVAVKGLNPAHGQPEHRCDIPEGSPLSSAPTTTTNSPQTITTTSNAPAKTFTAAGMNPAHGEPGHRCDISVGAPLNSPVEQAPAPAQTVEQ